MNLVCHPKFLGFNFTIELNRVIHSMKDKILKLRNQGLSFRDIEVQLGCSKALISYYCSQGQKRKNQHRTTKSRRQRKKYFVELFGGKCIKCGYDNYIEALDFHHRDISSKKENPSWLMRCSVERAKEELKKCDLLCCRCHREVHSDIDMAA